MGKLDQQLSRAHVHRHDAPGLGGGRDRAGHCNGENRQANQSGHSAAGFQQDRLRLRMPPGGARPCVPAAPMKRGLTATGTVARGGMTEEGTTRWMLFALALFALGLSAGSLTIGPSPLSPPPVTPRL